MKQRCIGVSIDAPSLRIKLRMIPRLIATIAVLAMPVTAFAHGGGLNKMDATINARLGTTIVTVATAAVLVLALARLWVHPHHLCMRTILTVYSQVSWVADLKSNTNTITVW